MKDFQLRNDTKLLFRNDPTADLETLLGGKRVLFIYGGSAKRNGCYEDIKQAVEHADGILYELGGSCLNPLGQICTLTVRYLLTC